MDANTYYLAQHEAQEAKSDLREEAIWAEIKELMKGNEYDPFFFQNFREALSESSDSDIMMLANFVDIAKCKPESDTAKRWAVEQINDIVVKYWTEAARVKAEKIVDERE